MSGVQHIERIVSEYLISLALIDHDLKEFYRAEFYPNSSPILSEKNC